MYVVSRVRVRQSSSHALTSIAARTAAHVPPQAAVKGQRQPGKLCFTRSACTSLVQWLRGGRSRFLTFASQQSLQTCHPLMSLSPVSATGPEQEELMPDMMVQPFHTYMFANWCSDSPWCETHHARSPCLLCSALICLAPFPFALGLPLHACIFIISRDPHSTQPTLHSRTNHTPSNPDSRRHRPRTRSGAPHHHGV